MPERVRDGDFDAASFLKLSAALTAVGVVVVTDGWRPAALALVAGGAVLATRLRFADGAAVALLAAVAILTLAGHGVGGG